MMPPVKKQWLNWKQPKIADSLKLPHDTVDKLFTEYLIKNDIIAIPQPMCSSQQIIFSSFYVKNEG